MLLTASTSEDYASATTREQKSITDTDIDTARGTDTDTTHIHIHTLLQLQHCICVSTRHVSLLNLPHESMAANWNVYFVFICKQYADVIDKTHLNEGERNITAKQEQQQQQEQLVTLNTNNKKVRSNKKKHKLNSSDRFILYLTLG